MRKWLTAGGGFLICCLLCFGNASRGWAADQQIFFRAGTDYETAVHLAEAIKNYELVFLDEKERYIWPVTYEALGISGQIKTDSEGWTPKYALEIHYDLAYILEYIEGLYGDYLDEARDAYFQISYDNQVTIVPEKDGQQLLLNIIGQQVEQALRAPLKQNVIVLKSQWTHPQISAEDLAGYEINGLLGEFSTRFDASNQSRVNNVWLASSKINDVIVSPGEIFSFNETVGPRTKERGFAEAGVIRNQQHDVDVGGGVCQVATTLYNAARVSGMTLVERHSHSLPVHYVEKGRDAAVVYGEKDLRFKNDTEHAVLIRSYFAYGQLLFKFYGNV